MNRDHNTQGSGGAGTGSGSGSTSGAGTGTGNGGSGTRPRAVADLLRHHPWGRLAVWSLAFVVIGLATRHCLPFLLVAALPRIDP